MEPSRLCGLHFPFSVWRQAMGAWQRLQMQVVIRLFNLSYYHIGHYDKSPCRCYRFRQAFIIFWQDLLNAS
jgi:hypothetical protein